MVGSILDAILAQAKSAVSRGYLAAGLFPAVTLAFGLSLYEFRGVAALRKAIAPQLQRSATQLSAESLLYVTVVIVIGVGFYFGRGMVLRTLRDVPGPFLRWLRTPFMAQHINLWWKQRRRNTIAERHLDVAGRLLNGTLAAEIEPIGQTPVGELLQRSGVGRAAFDGALSSPQQLSKASIDTILGGLTAYFTVPTAKRRRELPQWGHARTCPGAEELMERLYAEARRRAFAVAKDINEFPRDEWWVAPTRLGNRVAALEDYAKKRYKISTTTLFTRLWGTLGQAERTEIAGAQLNLETFANLTAAFAALAAIVTGLSARRTIDMWGAGLPVQTDWWTLAFVSASVVLCYGSYSATIFAFNAVAESITRLIDLHRVRVLIAFGFVPPETFGEEQGLFEQLDQFFARGTDTNLKNRKLEARPKAVPPPPK